jgi:hypothetical protein
MPQASHDHRLTTYQVNSYKPLICLWVAPAFAVAGLAVS